LKELSILWKPRNYSFNQLLLTSKDINSEETSLPNNLWINLWSERHVKNKTLMLLKVSLQCPHKCHFLKKVFLIPKMHVRSHSNNLSNFIIFLQKKRQSIWQVLVRAKDNFMKISKQKWFKKVNYYLILKKSSNQAANKILAEKKESNIKMTLRIIKRIQKKR